MDLVLSAVLWKTGKTASRLRISPVEKSAAVYHVLGRSKLVPLHIVVNPPVKGDSPSAGPLRFTHLIHRRVRFEHEAWKHQGTSPRGDSLVRMGHATNAAPEASGAA